MERGRAQEDFLFQGCGRGTVLNQGRRAVMVEKKERGMKRTGLLSMFTDSMGGPRERRRES